MKYFLTLYSAPDADPVPGTPEFDAMMGEYFSLEQRVGHIAKFLAGEGLKVSKPPRRCASAPVRSRL